MCPESQGHSRLKDSKLLASKFLFSLRREPLAPAVCLLVAAFVCALCTSCLGQHAGTAWQLADTRAAAGLSSASELMRIASAAALTVAWSQPRRMLAASSCALDAAIRQPRKVLEASIEASNSALDAACDVAWRAPARKVMEASNAALSAACRQPRRVLYASNAALGWGIGLLPLQARPVLGPCFLHQETALHSRSWHWGQHCVYALWQRYFVLYASSAALRYGFAVVQSRLALRPGPGVSAPRVAQIFMQVCVAVQRSFLYPQPQPSMP